MDGVPSDRIRGQRQSVHRPDTFQGHGPESGVRGRARVPDPGLVLPAPPDPVHFGEPAAGTVYSSGGQYVVSGDSGTRAVDSTAQPTASGTPAGPTPRPGRSRHRTSRRRRQLPLWQEVPLLLLAAFLIAVLIRTFLLQAFYIPSGSMEHTLDVGDKVLVNKVVYGVRDPVRGEIVVFRGTDRWAPEHQDQPTGIGGQIGRTLGDLVGFSQPGEKDFIKRVIAVPGDTVECCDRDGRVTVNGRPLRESYIFEDALDNVPPSATECRSRTFQPVTVPSGHIFVLGDHRIVSQDSRCQGPVPIQNVIGRAFLVVWPTDRWHVLEVPNTFEGVPKSHAARESATRYRPEEFGTAFRLPAGLLRDARTAACCRVVRIRPQRRLAW